MPKPPTPDAPQLSPEGSTSMRISWSIPETEPEVTACTVKVRIVGSQRFQNYDHSTGRLVPKGGSTVPAPMSEVVADGCLEGIAYEAILAVMNSEGWSDVSASSESACIGELKPRAKPLAPLVPTLTVAGKGKLKCTWELPEACPPVEASQVQLTDVGAGTSLLVDAATCKPVTSGRTTFASPRCEVTIVGVQEGIEWVAAVCCRNAEGFGEYSMVSDGVALSGAGSGSSGMELVLSNRPSAESVAPFLEPVGDSQMKISWNLPSEAKSTTVKIRRVGESNWRLCGGSTIPEPASETIANGIEDGIEYEAIVSFLVDGRWSPDSPVSRPACIGEIRLPGLPPPAKEPWLFVVEDNTRLRVKWRIPTTVPPVNAVFVKIRALGGRQWFHVPKSGIPTPEEGEPMLPPTNELDILGLHAGVRYEACVRLRNKLGSGPDSPVSEVACIGRPQPRYVKCMYCYQDFDLEHAEYLKSPEHFWCPGCRFRNMDPFNAVVEPAGMLACRLVTRPVFNLTVDVPDLKLWRKEEHSVQMRMVRIDSDNCAQVWPQSLTMEANGNEVFKVEKPEEGHIRRDVPRNIAPGLKPGRNDLTIKIEDDYVAGFAMALVHTYPRTVQMIATDIAVHSEEQARARVCSLLSDNWAVKQDEAEEDDEDEISCVISNKLKLRCPLSFERVVIPVRGETCQHLQCFGLGAYLESNVKMRALNNRWTCPVCANVLRPRDLRIDGYVDRVLGETQEHVEEVLIMPEGQYRVIEEERPKAPRIEKPAKRPDGEEDEVLEATVLPQTIDDAGGEQGTKRKEAPSSEAPLTQRQRRRQRMMSVEEEDSD